MAWEVLKELEELEGAREAGIGINDGKYSCLGEGNIITCEEVCH